MIFVYNSFENDICLYSYIFNIHPSLCFLGCCLVILWVEYSLNVLFFESFHLTVLHQFSLWSSNDTVSLVFFWNSFIYVLILSVITVLRFILFGFSTDNLFYCFLGSHKTSSNDTSSSPVSPVQYHSTSD